MAHAARCPNLRSLAAECRKPYGFDGRGHWLKRLLFVKTAWNIKRRRTNNGLGDQNGEFGVSPEMKNFFTAKSSIYAKKGRESIRILGIIAATEKHVGGVPSIACGLLSTR